MHRESVREVTSHSSGWDFGYSWVWTYGHLVLMVPFLGTAAIAWLVGAPAWIVAALLAPAAWAFIGFLIMRFLANFNELPKMPTPDYLPGATGNVLDLGCGLGRATIMVALARPSVHITALDNFSASYIKDHGEAALAHNLRVAGVDDRVTIQEGDILRLPFESEMFDALVSSFAIDHTSDVALALAEAKRVLRRGGQFLLLVGVPSVRMAIAFGPLFALNWHRMRSRADWRRELESAGFTLAADGPARSAAWFLINRPGPDGF